MYGEFTTHLRPGPRVRKLDAADLAVVEPLDRAWLIDSHGLVCLECGAKVPTVEGAVAHREGCEPCT